MSSAAHMTGMVLTNRLNAPSSPCVMQRCSRIPDGKRQVHPTALPNDVIPPSMFHTPSLIPANRNLTLHRWRDLRTTERHASFHSASRDGRRAPRQLTVDGNGVSMGWERQRYHVIIRTIAKQCQGSCVTDGHTLACTQEKYVSRAQDRARQTEVEPRHGAPCP